MRPDPITILLAEDDDGHALLVERHLRRAGFTERIARVCDGQEALDFVFGTGEYAGRAPDGPLIVLLDIRMPRIDGVEVLRLLRAAPQTSGLPVLMLTTTDNPHEITRCYQLGCSLYVTKPVSDDDLTAGLQRLASFLSVVAVPREDTLWREASPS